MWCWGGKEGKQRCGGGEKASEGNEKEGRVGRRPTKTAVVEGLPSPPLLPSHPSSPASSTCWSMFTWPCRRFSVPQMSLIWQEGRGKQLAIFITGANHINLLWTAQVAANCKYATRRRQQQQQHLAPGCPLCRDRPCVCVHVCVCWLLCVAQAMPHCCGIKCVWLMQHVACAVNT